MHPGRFNKNLLHDASGEFIQGFKVEDLHTPRPKPFPGASPLQRVSKSDGEPENGTLDIRFAPYVSGKAVVDVTVTDASGESAVSALPIILPEPPPPSVTIISGPTLSRATGLYEQQVTIRNDGGRAIAGFELLLRNLRQGVVLYNGVMLEDGRARLVYSHPLAAGESLTLTLTYYANPRGDVPSPDINSSAWFPTEETAARMSQPSKNLPLLVTEFLRPENGNPELEFSSKPGTRYYVDFSSDCRTWIPCPIPIDAAGTKVRWADPGPPFTSPPPGEAVSRFYRVREMDN